MNEPNETPVPVGLVTVRGGRAGFAQEILMGAHSLTADEPITAGGTDAGPTPYDLLLAALGACTSMTLRVYADRKKWPLEEVTVRLRHTNVHAVDCAERETTVAKIDRIDCEIELVGPLSDEQRARLLEIAPRCPVHMTLGSEIKMETTLW